MSWDVACEYFVAMQARKFGNEARELRALLKETTSHAALLEFIDAFTSADVTTLLPRISAPTFIPFEPNHNFYSLDLATSLAEGIPGAQLAMFDDKGAGHDAFAAFVHRHSPGRPNGSVGSTADRVGSVVLSAREYEVLALVAVGKTNREIGDLLVIAEHTVTRHVHNILTKLGLSNRVEASNWWARHAPVVSRA